MREDRTAELLQDMEAQMAACLVSVTNMDKQTARVAARKVSAHLSKHWGGQLLYFPKNHFGKLSERDAEIWREFNGTNHAALAMKYDLTMQQVYKIVKDARAYFQSQNQKDMFEEQPEEEPEEEPEEKETA